MGRLCERYPRTVAREVIRVREIYLFTIEVDHFLYIPPCDFCYHSPHALPKCELHELTDRRSVDFTLRKCGPWDLDGCIGKAHSSRISYAPEMGVCFWAPDVARCRQFLWGEDARPSPALASFGGKGRTL